MPRYPPSETIYRSAKHTYSYTMALTGTEEDPVDPTSVAAAATAIIVHYLTRIANAVADETAGSAAHVLTAKLGAFYRWLDHALRRDIGMSGALERLEEQPTNQHRQTSFQDVLMSLYEEDPSFARRLAESVEEIRSQSRIISQIVDAGATSVEGNVYLSGTNVAGRDLIIGHQQLPNQK